MITITITPKTPAQMTAALRLLEQFNGESTLVERASLTVEKPEETTSAPKPKRAKPAATPAAAETAPAEAAEPAAASESHSETAPAPVPPVTLEEVRAKLAALSQAGKKAEAKALLDQFGVAKLTDLPADKYAEVLAAAEEI